MALDDYEPAKLTKKMRAEITHGEANDDMVKPVNVVSPEVVEGDYEDNASVTEPEETAYIETAKVEELDQAPKVRKTKRKGPEVTESR
jgi:hypothetical protein